MNDRLSERLKVVIDEIIDGYEKLKEIELQGTEKENLRKELIRIRDACEEVPSLFAETAREIGLDVEKLTPLANFVKVDFIHGIKAQLMMITEPNSPSNKEWTQMQGNMAITIMNMNGQIDQLRVIRKIIG